MKDKFYGRRVIAKLFCLIFLISACTPQIEPGPVNYFGGIGRTNSYEHYGSVKNSSVTVDLPDSTIKIGLVEPPLPISSFQTIAAFNDSTVRMLEGANYRWKVHPGGGIVAAGLCADENLNSYALTLDGKLHKINYKGEIEFSKPLDQEITNRTIYGDLLALHDGIVATTSDGLIEKISLEGKNIWSRKSEYYAFSTVSAFESGKLAVAATYGSYEKSDSLLILDKDGKLIASAVTDSIRLLHHPVIANGIIYLSGTYSTRKNRMNYLMAFDSSANLLWKKTMPFSARYISADQEGKIYVTGYNVGIGLSKSGVYCYDPDGNEQWSIWFDAQAVAHLVIAEQNIGLIAKTKEALGVFFMRKEGYLSKSVSVTDVPMVYSKPGIYPGGLMIFGGIERLCQVRLDDSML